MASKDWSYEYELIVRRYQKALGPSRRRSRHSMTEGDVEVNVLDSGGSCLGRKIVR